MEIRKFSKIPLNRIIALVLMDIMCIVVTSFGALYIRYEFSFQSIDPVFLQSYENIMVPNVLMTLSFFVIWKLYKSVWRYASANELINIIMAAVCASLAQLIFCTATGNRMPRSYYVLYCFLLTTATCCIRFGYRILRIINNKRASMVERGQRLHPGRGGAVRNR